MHADIFATAFTRWWCLYLFTSSVLVDRCHGRKVGKLLLDYLFRPPRVLAALGSSADMVARPLGRSIRKNGWKCESSPVSQINFPNVTTVFMPMSSYLGIYLALISGTAMFYAAANVQYALASVRAATYIHRELIHSLLRTTLRCVHISCEDPLSID